MSIPSEEIVGVYRRHARAWSNARGACLMEKGWIDRFLNLLSAKSDVLDVGCGSGRPIASYLAQKGHRVTGIDSSPEMIEMFHANLPDQIGIVADMRTLQLEQEFDGVLAWDSFFHLTYEHQRFMFEIFKQHARPGAPLMFTSGPNHGEAIGMLEGDPLYHASLEPIEYVRLLNEQSFVVLHHVAEDETCGGRTVWLAQRVT